MEELGGSSSPGISRRALLAGAGACLLCAAGGGAGLMELAGGRAPGARRPVRAARRVALTDDGSSRRAVQPDALFRVQIDERVVALTFDDGPDDRYTPQVLDLLRERCATATFFSIGVNALGHPSLIRRALAEGHAVANHTYDHPVLAGLDPDAVTEEITGGTRALVDAGAPTPTLFRPPKGFTDRTVGRVADAQRLRTVFWTACVEHYVDHADVGTGVDRLLGDVGPGAIILAHDGGRVLAAGHPVVNRRRTLAALPLLLDGLSDRGYEVVDVATLLERARARRGPAGRGCRDI